jgi:hypothetical protein
MMTIMQDKNISRIHISRCLFNLICYAIVVAGMLPMAILLFWPIFYSLNIYWEYCVDLCISLVWIIPILWIEYKKKKDGIGYCLRTLKWISYIALLSCFFYWAAISSATTIDRARLPGWLWNTMPFLIGTGFVTAILITKRLKIFKCYFLKTVLPILILDALAAITTVAILYQLVWKIMQ